MQIYYLPIVSNVWEKKENLLLKYVSQKRQEKVLKYKYELDQKLSLYAALIVRMGISALTDICASDLQFSSQPNHKPFLLSDKNVDFNISHTKSAILCAISLNNSIGVDIEKIHLSPPLEIMSQVFHPKEIQYINLKRGPKRRHILSRWELDLWNIPTSIILLLILLLLNYIVGRQMNITVLFVEKKNFHLLYIL